LVSPTNTSRVFYNKKARKKRRGREREKEERKKERREGKRKKEEAVIKLFCFASTQKEKARRKALPAAGVAQRMGV
jgi:hypothetical protein